MRRVTASFSRLARLAVVAGLVLAVVPGRIAGAQTAQGGAAAPTAAGFGADFFDRIDLSALGQVAVQRDGRVKSFESFAREIMGLVSGPRRYQDRPAAITYLDLMLRPEAYADASIVYVKSKLVRSQIADALRASMAEQLDALHLSDLHGQGPAGGHEAELTARLEDELATFMKTGLISEPMLSDPKVTALLGRLETDLLTSAKFVRMIDTALQVKDPGFLRGSLRLVPPAGGGVESRWLTPDELEARLFSDDADAAPPMSPEMSKEVLGGWNDLQSGWMLGDADAVNAAFTRLAAVLPRISPELYPDASRLAWEGWYFKMKNMTWVWIFYALCLIPLILHVVFRWPGARWLGIGLFLIAFGLHTFAVMLRWYVAQRWPNTNMFEAVTTSAWFGGCFAILLEVLLRRMPVRGLFALGSATASMFALMAAHFLPIELSADIGNRMPVLHDVWLYIHTNVIIFSYCLIFIASVSAALYLLYRAGKALTGGGGSGEYARVGGAGSLILTTPDGQPYLVRGKTSLGQILDGTTMIVLELAFILLWSGIVMGAIWADHSWGRPWGWDPKEVFALNTFIIFALLVHVRLKVRDKGLWTALLAVAGCAVMLFNWIVINFTISGLHSYA